MRDYLKPYVLKLTFLSASLFLVWHTVLLCVFAYEQVWPLAGLNILSICIYIHAMFALKNHQTRGVIRLMYVELLIFMIISVVCMGWEYRFQEYAFGILPIIMFGDYIEDANRLRRSSIAMVISVVVGYIGLSIWSTLHAPFYAFATRLSIPLFGILNGAATMFMVAVYFLVFTYMVLGFERGLIHDASYDSLTGLANRRVLYDYRGQLEQMQDYCVFMIDIDNFKSINDRYGHDVGDRVLEATGKLLTENRHKLNRFLPIRWGGEEFVVVYADTGLEREEKIRQMEQIRQQIGELRVVADDNEICFSATVGAAVCGEDAEIDGLIGIADSRMYYGKAHGKNCLVYTHDEWRNTV